MLTLLKNPKHTETVLICGWLSKDNVSLSTQREERFTALLSSLKTQD